MAFRAELKSSSSERWAFISPEPGKEGMYRATFFDMSGFTNHHRDARPDELLLVSGGHGLHEA